MAGVKKEVYADFVLQATWEHPDNVTEDARDLSRFVNNDKINLQEAGEDPEVIWDRSTWPIPDQQRTDNPLDIPLHYVDTGNTLMRDRDLQLINYNKISSVTQGHQRSLRKAYYSRACYEYGPRAETAQTPIIEASGSQDAEGFNLLLDDDIVKLAKAFDARQYPQSGRTLVVPSEMFWNMVQNNSILKEQYKQQQAVGTIGVGGEEDPRLFIHGFTIKKMPEAYAPTYKKVSGSYKKWSNFYSSPGSGYHRAAIAYIRRQNIFRARGSADMWQQRDIRQRGTLVGIEARVLFHAPQQQLLGAIVRVPTP
jgi:hypothetical protein